MVWCAVATVIVFVLGWTLTAISAMANINLGQRVAYDVAADVFHHLQKLSLRFHARKGTGDSIRRVLTDSAAVSSIAKDAILPAISSFLTLIAIFIVLVRLDWKLTLLAMLVVPYLVWVLKRYAAPMLDRSYKQQEIEGGIYSSLEQTLYAIPVVQAYTREDLADQMFREQTDRAYVGTLSLTALQLKFKVLVGLSTAFGTALVFWMGGHEFLLGKISRRAISSCSSRISRCCLRRWSRWRTPLRHCNSRWAALVACGRFSIRPRTCGRKPPRFPSSKRAARCR